MNAGASSDVESVVVQLHPGPTARASCDWQRGELPVLVIADRGARVLLSALDAPTVADVQFAESLLAALGEYDSALRAMAG